MFARPDEQLTRPIVRSVTVNGRRLIQFEILGETFARREVLSEQLFELLQKVDGVSFPDVVDADEVSERSEVMEIVVAIVSSAAGVQLAHALRDWIKRRKVRLEIRDNRGLECKLEMVGGELAGMDDIRKMLSAMSDVSRNDSQPPLPPARPN